MAAWPARIGFFLLPALPVFMLTKELSARRFPGRFIYPDYFGFFKFLFHLQEGLLVGLIVAVAGLAAARIANRWVRFAIYFPVSLWVAWLVVWAIVRAAFTMELSPRYAIALLIQPSAISGVGLERTFFYTVIAISFGLIFAMSILGTWLSRRVTVPVAHRVALLLLILFLFVHVPVRAYIVYHVNRERHAVLALDDWSPVALRSEYLIPGIRARRASLPNLEKDNRTRAYMNWIKHVPKPEIPRKIDMVWITIEAFRADAISEKTTPYLWSHADEFQLKLDRNHWSGGNASQFGLFSMFSGISGYHLQTFIREGIPIPFLNLLAQNGYRIRVADRGYFKFAQFPSVFFPPGTLTGKAHGRSPEKADASMTDALLEDMNARSPGPSIDIIPFDATHWPFAYWPEDKIFEPAGAVSHGHFTRTPAEAEEAHNRFRNASRGVDRQIARIVEALRARKALDHTILIVTGDHGEEFLERGQVFHCGAMNDFQGRPVLWMHFPDISIPAIKSDDLTSHTDIVPTLLDFLGFNEDVLRTQGQTLFHPAAVRSALLTSEQGYYFPAYHALVTKDYVSRWRHTTAKFLFSGVERRDGRPVIGNEWFEQAKALYPGAADQYEILPNPDAPPIKYR
jgi:membrane-anchored protein YejM (alkaline phosphatase superfamily)